MKAEIKQVIPLLEEFSPVAIYLFGSASKDNLRQDSDIDLAFYSQGEIDEYVCFIKAQQIASLLNRDVTLKDLSKTTIPLQVQVIGTGTVLYCNDEFKRILWGTRKNAANI